MFFQLFIGKTHKSFVFIYSLGSVFRPCVFNNLLGGTFIFNILFFSALCFQQLIGILRRELFNELRGTLSIFGVFRCWGKVQPQEGAGEKLTGVAGFRQACIATLAYTF